MDKDKEKLTGALVDGSVLASPPDLLFKIINSLDSELSSYQIGEIIGHDQSVSAQVLKLSNSSFFGFKGEIKTLDRAINILGTKTVRNIAVTTLLFTHTNRIRLYNLDMFEFWLQTFLVADLTRELSQKVGLDGDEAYIAGLLHHIGKLILYAKRQEPEPLFSRPHRTAEILDYERRTWGVDSIELTEVLLKKWNIPADIVEGIGDHRNFQSPSMLGKVVFLADILGNIITDKHYQSDLTFDQLREMLKVLKMSLGDFYRFSMDIPGIAERGKMIMKVLSKNRPVASFKRVQNKVTLVTPYEYSLSAALLKLLGFSVDMIPFSALENYENKAKIEEESRRLMTGTSSVKIPEEKKATEKQVKEPSPGLFGNLLNLFLSRKSEAHTVKKEEEEQKPEPKAFSWHPIVVFEHLDPIPINRLTVSVFQVSKHNESKISGEGTEDNLESGTRVVQIPLLFSNSDLERKR